MKTRRAFIRYTTNCSPGRPAQSRGGLASSWEQADPVTYGSSAEGGPFPTSELTSADVVYTFRSFIDPCSYPLAKAPIDH